jgi:hypothetical protein
MRYGNRWTVNEILALQREYELLEWSVQQIAEKHRRSVRAILCKLEVEGFIASWDEARGFVAEGSMTEETVQSNGSESAMDDSESTNIDSVNIDSVNIDSVIIDSENIAQQNDELTMIDDNETSEHIGNLTDRVWNLETSVSEISSMVKQMFECMVSKKSSKKNKLRKY